MTTPETPADAAIRTKLDELALRLRHFHSALLDVAKEEYQFLHGPIKSPYELFSLVTTNESFQWLRPLSGLMATLDEVLDAKNTTLTRQNLTDVQHALGSLFAATETQFADFRAGYTRARSNPKVRETEESWRSVLSSLEA